MVSSALYLAGRPTGPYSPLVLAEVADVGISEHTKGVPLPQFKKLTPNLLVASVERSLAFYVDTLGFSRGMTVPDAPPFAFGSVTGDAVEIFFNEAGDAVKEYPAFGGKPIGATGTLFIEVAVSMRCTID